MSHSPKFMWEVRSFCTILPVQHMLLVCFGGGIGLLQSCYLPSPSVWTTNISLATVQLQQSGAEFSDTWVPSSGKEATQQGREIDNLRRRQKPWSRPLFTPRGSGYWVVGLSRPASWCKLTDGASYPAKHSEWQVRGNGKWYFKHLKETRLSMLH